MQRYGCTRSAIHSCLGTEESGQGDLMTKKFFSRVWAKVVGAADRDVLAGRQPGCCSPLRRAFSKQASRNRVSAAGSSTPRGHEPGRCKCKAFRFDGEFLQRTDGCLRRQQRSVPACQLATSPRQTPSCGERASLSSPHCRNDYRAMTCGDGMSQKGRFRYDRIEPSLKGLEVIRVYVICPPRFGAVSLVAPTAAGNLIVAVAGSIRT
jgi:hypothetical protein